MDTRPASPMTAPSAIDPMEYLRTLIRRKWIVAAVLLAVVGAATLWTIRTPRMYLAATSMIIEPNAPRILDQQVADVSQDVSGSYWYNKDYYETQFKVILSRAVSARVVDKLGLQHDSAFLAGLPSGTQVPPEKAKLLVSVDAVSLLQGKIQVEPVKDSRIVYVQVEDRDPKRAALLANEVADAYVAENLALKMKLSDTAHTWLEARHKELKEESRANELAVYEFKKKSDLLATSIENSQTMISQRLTAINAKLTDVRTRIAAITARAAAIEKVKLSAAANEEFWASALPTSVESALIKELKVRYAETKGECAAYADRYLPDHPKVHECKNRLGALSRDLTEEFANVVRTTEVELSEATLEQANLTALLKEARSESLEINKRQFELDTLNRQTENSLRLYDLVFKRLKDIELSSMLRTSNARVLDAARPPGSPISPRVFLNLAVAVVFGLLGGVAFAFIAEFLDSRVYTQEQVEGLLGLTFLGILPTQEGRERVAKYLNVLEQSRSAMAECARAIRTNVLFMSPEKSLRSILVTSAAPSEGKTTTAVSLAITMAESGSRVLLIDADMRRPMVHSAFGVANGEGLSSIIVGNGDLADVTKRTQVNNLDVLPCGPIPPNPAELLHTQRFGALLEEVLRKYDRVIIDSPPVVAVSDAAVIATKVDGVLTVVKAGTTSRDSARRMVRALKAVNARLLGAVLNDVDLERRGYGGYYAQGRYGYYSEREPV